MRPVRTFLRSYRGTYPLGRSALSLLRCGEHPRGYPDVASGRCTGTLRQRGRERLLEVHVRKTRSPVIPARKGGIVRSDIRVPEAKRGRVPLQERRKGIASHPPSLYRNEDEYRFPCGAKHPRSFQTELRVSPRVVRPGGFTFSRFRRQNPRRCRSSPQPSAHEYAAPYPAPSPPGTRPRGESPWGQRRGRYRRTAP